MNRFADFQRTVSQSFRGLFRWLRFAEKAFSLARAAARFAELPLIAILRGVTPDEVVRVGRSLVETGFRLIDVPLNSPEPIGGITPESMHAYRAVGAAGFGLGSALYKPGMTSTDVRRTAESFVAAWRTSSLMD